uniref:Cystein proteinase inhibitor protein salarin n=1 Tax=Myripristis murdjan TaxID=586833 RepID=A0A667ZEY3_9TELE
MEQISFLCHCSCRMLPCVCVLLLAASTLGLQDEATLDAQWEEWKLTHRKEYNGLVSEGMRRAIWVKNMRMIEAHNQEAALGLHSYELGMNHLGDMTSEEVLNTIPIASAQKVVPVPVLSVVFYCFFLFVCLFVFQGSCGSCWAFSAVGALEGQLAKKTGRLVDLSPQNLVDCDVKSSGCKGGYMTTAFRYVQRNGGIDSEAAYPYVGKDQRCRYCWSGRAAQCKGFVEIPRGCERLLAVALYKVGPISVGIDASQSSFQFYQSGVYSDPGCNRAKINHAVLAVGYGVTASGKKYWIVKNSWSESWGDKGYILMARERRNLCGIADLASYPIM